MESGRRANTCGSGQAHHIEFRDGENLKKFRTCFAAQSRILVTHRVVAQKCLIGLDMGGTAGSQILVLPWDEHKTTDPGICRTSL